MSSFDGKHVWYELMTTDAGAAERFYSSVLSWQVADSGMTDVEYLLISVGGGMLGGIMELPPAAAGARPNWTAYIAVDDVDEYARRVTAAGGIVHRKPDDIPGVGRFAMVADPQGAGFVLFKGSSAEGPQLPKADAEGTVGWHELHAKDWPPAFAFYAELFGWKKGEAVNMGPMGIYQLFTTGDDAVGGMMSSPDGSPHWLYYFNVADIDAGKARVLEHGGTVERGPHQVPGGSWIVHCIDPQGAAFALVGPDR